jgi:phage virion morphogenesis protein
VSIALHVDIAAIDRLAERVARLGSLDRSQLLEDLGAEVESQTKRRIEDEKRGPDGTPWAAWSESYAKTRHQNHSLLMAEGNLDDSIQHLVTGGNVEIGSNLVYASTHQFGLDMSVLSTKRRVTVPARPYLGLSGENISDLAAIVDDFLDRQLEAL